MSVAVLGSINMDVVLSVQDLPRPGETISALSKAHFPGGKGANQTIASARAGSKTSMIGAIGNDQFGDALIANLAENSIDTSAIAKLADTDTGQAYINVSSDGENAIVVVPGANHAFRYPKIDPKGLSSAKVRLAQLEMPIDAVRSFFAGAHHNGSVTRILNAAPALPRAKNLFPLTDVLIVNETELAVFADRAVEELTTVDEISAVARALLVRDSQWVVVTLGSKGAMAVSCADLILVPSFPADVVDTTGAGDCFCGVFAACLSEGETMKDALMFASAAASLSVRKMGAGPSMPCRGEVLSLLANAPKQIEQRVSG